VVLFKPQLAARWTVNLPDRSNSLLLVGNIKRRAGAGLPVFCGVEFRNAFAPILMKVAARVTRLGITYWKDADLRKYRSCYALPPLICILPLIEWDFLVLCMP
jgi:hypothetical protein